MNESEFTALMERIPVMEEKLNQLLLVFAKIAESGNITGVKTCDEFPHFKYDEEKAKADAKLVKLSEEKLAAARILEEEANGIREQLGI